MNEEDRAKKYLSPRKLRSVPNSKWVGGVCGGIAYWLGCPAWLVRLVWVYAAIFYGVGGVVYILLWILMPKWDEIPADYQEVTGD